MLNEANCFSSVVHGHLDWQWVEFLPFMKLQNVVALQETKQCRKPQHIRKIIKMVEQFFFFAGWWEITKQDGELQDRWREQNASWTVAKGEAEVGARPITFSGCIIKFPSRQ